MAGITFKMQSSAGTFVRVGNLSFDTRQMLRLAEFAVSTVKQRIMSAVGSDDNHMAALSQKHSGVLVKGKFVRQRVGYAGFKAAHGLKPERDLVGTGKDGGHMLDNFTVRYADSNSTRMAFTARKARAKALSNEKRTPFFSFSESDQKKIIAKAAEIFGQEVVKKQILDPVRRALKRAA